MIKTGIQELGGGGKEYTIGKMKEIPKMAVKSLLFNDRKLM